MANDFRLDGEINLDDTKAWAKLEALEKRAANLKIGTPSHLPSAMAVSSFDTQLNRQVYPVIEKVLAEKQTYSSRGVAPIKMDPAVLQGVVDYYMAMDRQVRAAEAALATVTKTNLASKPLTVSTASLKQVASRVPLDDASLRMMVDRALNGGSLNAPIPLAYRAAAIEKGFMTSEGTRGENLPKMRSDVQKFQQGLAEKAALQNLEAAQAQMKQEGQAGLITTAARAQRQARLISGDTAPILRPGEKAPTFGTTIPLTVDASTVEPAVAKVRKKIADKPAQLSVTPPKGQTSEEARKEWTDLVQGPPRTEAAGKHATYKEGGPDSAPYYEYAKGWNAAGKLPKGQTRTPLPEATLKVTPDVSSVEPVVAKVRKSIKEKPAKIDVEVPKEQVESTAQNLLTQVDKEIAAKKKAKAGVKATVGSQITAEAAKAIDDTVAELKTRSGGGDLTLMSKEVTMQVAKAVKIMLGGGKQPRPEQLERAIASEMIYRTGPGGAWEENKEWTSPYYTGKGLPPDYMLGIQSKLPAATAAKSTPEDKAVLAQIVANRARRAEMIEGVAAEAAELDAYIAEKEAIVGKTPKSRMGPNQFAANTELTIAKAKLARLEKSADSYKTVEDTLAKAASIGTPYTPPAGASTPEDLLKYMQWRNKAQFGQTSVRDVKDMLTNWESYSQGASLDTSIVTQMRQAGLIKASGRGLGPAFDLTRYPPIPREVSALEQAVLAREPKAPIGAYAKGAAGKLWEPQAFGLTSGLEARVASSWGAGLGNARLSENDIMYAKRQGLLTATGMPTGFMKGIPPGGIPVERLERNPLQEAVGERVSAKTQTDAYITRQREMGIALTRIGTAMVGVATTMTAAVIGAVKASDTLNLATSKLGQAMKATGEYSKVAADGFKYQAIELMKLSGMSVAATLDDMSYAKSLKLTNEQITALTPRVADIAVALGIDMQTAYKASSLALNGITTQMRRLGFYVTEGKDGFVGLDDILEATSGVMGAAEARGKTLTGALTRLKSAAALTSATFGATLSPTIIKVLDKVTSVVGSWAYLDSGFKKSIGTITGVIGVLGGLLGSLALVGGAIAQVNYGLAVMKIPALGAMAKSLVTGAGAKAIGVGLGTSAGIFVAIAAAIGAALIKYFSGTPSEKQAMLSNEGVNQGYGLQSATTGVKSTWPFAPARVTMQGVRQANTGIMLPGAGDIGTNWVGYQRPKAPTLSEEAETTNKTLSDRLFALHNTGVQTAFSLLKEEADAMKAIAGVVGADVDHWLTDQKAVVLEQATANIDQRFWNIGKTDTQIAKDILRDEIDAQIKAGPGTPEFAAKGEAVFAAEAKKIDEGAKKGWEPINIEGTSISPLMSFIGSLKGSAKEKPQVLELKLAWDGTTVRVDDRAWNSPALLAKISAAVLKEIQTLTTRASLGSP